MKSANTLMELYCNDLYILLPVIPVALIRFRLDGFVSFGNSCTFNLPGTKMQERRMLQASWTDSDMKRSWIAGISFL